MSAVAGCARMAKSGCAAAQKTEGVATAANMPTMWRASARS